MRAPPDETERLLGLQPGDLADHQEVLVWPENWPAVALFRALQTQWAVGPTGQLTGLRYEAIPVVCQALRIRPRRQRRLFAELQVMERAVLKALHEEQAHARPR